MRDSGCFGCLLGSLALCGCLVLAGVLVRVSCLLFMLGWSALR